MAGPTKKSKKPSESDSDNEQIINEISGQEEIDVMFEGRNPEGQDFYGIKQLLQQLFLKTAIDVSQLSDMLISQTGVGSVLKQSLDDDDDEDSDDVDMVDESHVFGITSVINLTAHNETPCIQQLYKLFNETSKKYAEKSVQDSIEQILASNNKLGLIINERLINIPSKISDAMLSSLHNEIQRIQKRNNSYNFDYFVMICKAWKPKGDKNGDLMFCKDEEQFFAKHSDYSYEFNVADKMDTGVGGNWDSEDKEFIQYRKILVFQAAKFNNILMEIRDYLKG